MNLISEERIERIKLLKTLREGLLNGSIKPTKEVKDLIDKTCKLKEEEKTSSKNKTYVFEKNDRAA